MAAAILMFPARSIAESNHIRIEISQSFDWSASSIRKLAAGTAAVFSSRCTRSCTITLRITLDTSLRGSFRKHLTWLHKAMIEEMARETGTTANIEDSIILL